MKSLILVTLAILPVPVACAVTPEVAERPYGVSCVPDSMQSDLRLLSKRGFTAEGASLARALGDSNWTVQMAALGVLETVAGPGELPAMRAMLRHPYEPMRLRAITALNKARTRLSSEVSSSLQNELATVAREILVSGQDKVQAAQALMDVTGDVTGYPVVLDALKSPDRHVRAYACGPALRFALEGIRDASGRPVDWVLPIAVIASDTSAGLPTRISALNALETIGTDESLATLRGIQATELDKHIRDVIDGMLERHAILSKMKAPNP